MVHNPQLFLIQKIGAHVRPSCRRPESSNMFTDKLPWLRPFFTKGLEFISAISLKRTPPVPNLQVATLFNNNVRDKNI